MFIFSKGGMSRMNTLEIMMRIVICIIAVGTCLAAMFGNADLTGKVLMILLAITVAANTVVVRCDR